MSVATTRLASLLQRARHQLALCQGQPAATDLVAEIDGALAEAGAEPDITALWHRLDNQAETIRRLQARLRDADRRNGIS